MRVTCHSCICAALLPVLVTLAFGIYLQNHFHTMISRPPSLVNSVLNLFFRSWRFVFFPSLYPRPPPFFWSTYSVTGVVICWSALSPVQETSPAHSQSPQRFTPALYLSVSCLPLGLPHFINDNRKPLWERRGKLESRLFLCDRRALSFPTKAASFGRVYSLIELTPISLPPLIMMKCAYLGSSAPASPFRFKPCPSGIPLSYSSSPPPGQDVARSRNA